MAKAPIRSAGGDLLQDAPNGLAAAAWRLAGSDRCNAAFKITSGCETD